MKATHDAALLGSSGVTGGLTTAATRNDRSVRPALSRLVPPGPGFDIFWEYAGQLNQRFERGVNE